MKLFTHWLRARAKDDNALGDLARDVLADIARSPKPPGRGPRAIRLRMLNSGASPAALTALDAAVEQWRAQLPNQISLNRRRHA